MYKDIIKRHEGLRSKVYKDSLGIPTIGVGFNLMRLDARDKLKAVGASYENLILGKTVLNNNQIEVLLEQDIYACIKDLKSLFPTFDTLPENVRLVLVDLRFNLGGKGLRGFKNTLKHLQIGNYSAAADSLAQSLWAKQVGKRATENINLLKAVPNGPS